jgi:acyl carrier protein
LLSDEERLDATFRLALGLADDVDLGETAYGRTEGWDSVGHMELIVGIEAAFGISIEADDVFAMSDFPAVRAVLRDRYSFKLQER